MSFEKVYLGKGRQVPNMNIAKITIPLETLQSIAYEREGVVYCTFQVSKMKQPDAFGREYTVYYNKKHPEAQEPAPEKTRKTGGRRKKQQEPADLPF